MRTSKNYALQYNSEPNEHEKTSIFNTNKNKDLSSGVPMN